MLATTSGQRQRAKGEPSSFPSLLPRLELGAATLRLGTRPVEERERLRVVLDGLRCRAGREDEEAEP